MAFGPVPQAIDMVDLEARVLARWRADGLAEQLKTSRAGRTAWVFYEGPPTANARPGVHHVWARVFKDLFIRFHTMRGEDVPRKGGWDCHGLPVEIEVEKELGITAKRQIEAYGIDRFNQRCRESVQRYVADFAALTDRAGVSIDTADAYWTMSNDYIESVWWLVRQLWDEGLLYEGHRVSPYCPRCGTALSSHELGQPGAYRDVVDPSVYVRFPVVDRDFDLLVWTTTPWTLVSNVAVAVAPDLEYVRIPVGQGRDVVLAAAAAPSFADEQTVAAAPRFPGRDLEGVRYRRPFEFLELDDRGQRVVATPFVTADAGSGLVHLAPAFGEDDMDAARAHDLPMLNPVGPDGAFNDPRLPWAGQRVKEADPGIVAELERRGVLVREEPYRHAYPHCWRCGTPLIYWAKTSWFIRTSECRDGLMAENETVAWHPEGVKHGRFGRWLQGNVDWALSRDRYWGTPLPVWRCRLGHDTCVGSVAELGRLAGAGLEGLDLHRPAVDAVVVACPEPGCGAEARRLDPVLDAWFDSGSMPSAQLHYPFEHGGDFGSHFPADFICEAIDQTRGWFYSLLAVNTLVFGKAPYRNVVCLELVVDEEGAKMSKSRGNVVDPWHIFATFGADALRWYFFSAGSPWTPRRVYEDGIREAASRTLLKLWSVLHFFALYADTDGWTGAPAGAAPTHPLDRWALHQLDECVAAVTTALEGYDVLAAATRLASFVDDLSNWYVRRSRGRFWRSSDPMAHATLHRCLTVASQLLAPFCPFLADEIWTTLGGGASVHLSDWPSPGVPSETQLATQMDGARRLVALGRAARVGAKVKVRQPLRRALLLHPGVQLDEEVRREIAEELNVKALEDVKSLARLISWTAVPNFRALGPRLGARVNAVKEALAAADGGAIREALEHEGRVTVAGVELGPDDLELRAQHHDELALAQDGTWAVALDLELDDELRREGTARELVHALNDLRKACGLELTDRVRVELAGGPNVQSALERHRDWVAGEILADQLVLVPSTEGHSVDVDGETVTVALEKVA